MSCVNVGLVAERAKLEKGIGKEENVTKDFGKKGHLGQTKHV